mmetsp:Transcript_27043/g.62674  ORF Transcript_27043/g.62674 Transcript_27043/m.62674 type:complete len:262 (-) Transcript_27043:100-885(-)
MVLPPNRRRRRPPRVDVQPRQRVRDPPCLSLYAAQSLQPLKEGGQRHVALGSAEGHGLAIRLFSVHCCDESTRHIPDVHQTKPPLGNVRYTPRHVLVYAFCAVVLEHPLGGQRLLPRAQHRSRPEYHEGDPQAPRRFSRHPLRDHLAMIVRPPPHQLLRVPVGVPPRRAPAGRHSDGTRGRRKHNLDPPAPGRGLDHVDRAVHVHPPDVRFRCPGVLDDADEVEYALDTLTSALDAGFVRDASPDQLHPSLPLQHWIPAPG